MPSRNPGEEVNRGDINCYMYLSTYLMYVRIRTSLPSFVDKVIDNIFLAGGPDGAFASLAPQVRGGIYGSTYAHTLTHAHDCNESRRKDSAVVVACLWHSIGIVSISHSSKWRCLQEHEFTLRCRL